MNQITRELQNIDIPADPKLDPDIQHLMNSMLDRDQKTRLDINGVLNHPAITKNLKSFEQPISSDDFKILIRNYFVNSPQKVTSEAPEAILKFVYHDHSTEVWKDLQEIFKNTGPIFGKKVEFNEYNSFSKTGKNEFDSFRANDNFGLYTTFVQSNSSGSRLLHDNLNFNIPPNTFAKPHEIPQKKVIKIDNSYDFWKGEKQQILNQNSQSKVAQNSETSNLNKQTVAVTETPQQIQNYSIESKQYQTSETNGANFGHKKVIIEEYKTNNIINNSPYEQGNRMQQPTNDSQKFKNQIQMAQKHNKVEGNSPCQVTVMTYESQNNSNYSNNKNKNADRLNFETQNSEKMLNFLKKDNSKSTNEQLQTPNLSFSEKPNLFDVRTINSNPNFKSNLTQNYTPFSHKHDFSSGQFIQTSNGSHQGPKIIPKFSTNESNLISEFEINPKIITETESSKNQNSKLNVIISQMKTPRTLSPSFNQSTQQNSIKFESYSSNYEYLKSLPYVQSTDWQFKSQNSQPQNQKTQVENEATRDFKKAQDNLSNDYQIKLNQILFTENQFRTTHDNHIGIADVERTANGITVKRSNFPQITSFRSGSMLEPYVQKAENVTMVEKRDGIKTPEERISRYNPRDRSMPICVSTLMVKDKDKETQQKPIKVEVNSTLKNDNTTRTLFFGSTSRMSTQNLQLINTHAEIPNRNNSVKIGEAKKAIRVYGDDENGRASVMKYKI